MMKETEYLVEFHFGKRPVKTFNLYLTAIILSLAVNLLTRFVKVSPNDIWGIIDEIGKKYEIRLINELVQQSPELLSARIDREVDKAIETYDSMVESEEPTAIFTEMEEGETPLGGEMRLRAPWIKDSEN